MKSIASVVVAVLVSTAVGGILFSNFPNANQANGEIAQQSPSPSPSPTSTPTPTTTPQS
ncbi:hypothetical protein H6G74_09890 [Nostoc spongiaeforme FACHB-130]|uniref:Uncharacterized protein n=1 Tax=Nostoc spongiaeforme FACHB-130 TaxID=1357510 RepID=A0ABR8FUJ7_9NOSO|nr:hypothetical protein [Nostoc spongiaeforme]MBD2594635.1 hypothetical protein [Nostoc spongiaeforme FACHB-130]